MGVRAYTHCMLTSTTTAGWTKAAHVIVDWSQPQSAPLCDHVEMNDLLRWIRTYPERTAIHVYLSRTPDTQQSRTLQNTLQSLGCRVTMRSTQAVTA